SDAVAAAAAVQRALAGPTGSGGAQIRVRIGLHTGQAVRVGNDYVGLDVHRAARIADAGNGGQVLISETTHEVLKGQDLGDLAFVDLGRHRLKDIGPERLWQLSGGGLPLGPFPPLRSLDAHPTNLPLAVSDLVDRDLERSELAALVATVSIVTITGAGGIGKTRLAIEVARSLLTGFPDGVFHLDLASTTDASDVAAGLIELMGLRVTPGEEPLSLLLDHLRNRDLLIVLDTADRVADLPSLAASIAAACPRTRMLVTSRSPLRVAAEREYSLSPLPADPAIELFTARARMVRPQFSLDGATRTAVEQLVARLDGIPLAIELAAARTRLFTPAALLDRLERHLPALGEGGRDLPDRQRTLHDTISWSVELLQPAERAAFFRLGVFAGSFDLAAVEAVVDADGEDPVGVLESLVNRSLVVVTPGIGDGEARFRLLAPIREFAVDMLAASDVDDEVRERYAAHWLGFVRRQWAALDEEGALAAVNAIRLEEADIRSALAWFLAAGGAGAANVAARANRGLDLAGRLGRYWWLRGRGLDGLPWLERALAATPDGTTEERARAFFWAGVLLDDARRPAEAERHLEAALAVRRDLGDDAGVAKTLNSLGVVARSVGHLDRAEALLRESIARKAALGDRTGTAVSLSNLGIVASDRGRHDEAVELMAQALAIDEVTGGLSLSVSCANLGAALVRAGRIEEGRAQVVRSLPGIEELEDPELVVETLTTVATIALAAATPESSLTAARLLFAVEVLVARERIPLRAADREQVDTLMAQAEERLDATALAAARAEARAIDLAGAIALARLALDETVEAAPRG
ncbi:MAG TPA: tetratricopeptide repeat protein, partial [Candidatus Limnocylindrales bacterium]|nr:tetratricopeptide repeat protein [Candidatus Limnocylindrales bacterium]